MIKLKSLISESNIPRGIKWMQLRKWQGAPFMDFKINSWLESGEMEALVDFLNKSLNTEDFYSSQGSRKKGIGNTGIAANDDDKIKDAVKLLVKNGVRIK